MKHLTRLRLLLLFVAAFLLVTGCSDDYNLNTTTGADNRPESTAKMLTGRQAQQQIDILVSELNKNGKKGTARLLKSMDVGAGSTLRTTLADVAPYIDSTAVLALTDSVNHKKNYTYRLNHPKANDTLFYNLVMRQYNGYRRITLITYKMDPTFAETYYETVDLTKFTGQVSFEIIAQDEGDPCEDENPGTGGGGAGMSNPYDGVYYPPSNVNNHQYLVGVHFMELYMTADNLEAEWINIHNSPRGFSHPGFRLFFNLNTSNGDPCDEDEVGVIGPEPDDCNKLKNLTRNLAIKNSLNALKSQLSQDKEKAFSFKVNAQGETTAVPQTNSDGVSARIFRDNQTYGIAHIHQDGATIPSELYKMFSLKDVQSAYKCAKGFDNSYDAPLFFNMMTVSNSEGGPYTYIVFPNNVDNFKNLIGVFLDINNFTRLDSNLAKIYRKNAVNGTDQLTLAKLFLKFVNNVGESQSGTNMNLSLYRVSNINNSIGIWEKIELDPTDPNKPVKLTPCN